MSERASERTNARERERETESERMKCLQWNVQTELITSLISTSFVFGCTRVSLYT